jgi:hypothetical protein
MVERLRSQWQQGMPFEVIVELRMTWTLCFNKIDLSTKCPWCGHVGRLGTNVVHVSIRAMILSLARFDIAPAGQIHAVEKTGQPTGSSMGSISRQERGADARSNRTLVHPPTR